MMLYVDSHITLHFKPKNTENTTSSPRRPHRHRWRHLRHQQRQGRHYDNSLSFIKLFITPLNIINVLKIFNHFGVIQNIQKNNIGTRTIRVPYWLR